MSRTKKVKRKKQYFDQQDNDTEPKAEPQLFKVDDTVKVKVESSNWDMNSYQKFKFGAMVTGFVGKSLHNMPHQDSKED